MDVGSRGWTPNSFSIVPVIPLSFPLMPGPNAEIDSGSITRDSNSALSCTRRQSRVPARLVPAVLSVLSILVPLKYAPRPSRAAARLRPIGRLGMMGL